MSTAGLLLFEDSAAGTSAARRRFGGLTSLERGIRTMARAGCRRLLVVTSAGTDVRLGRVTRRLDLELEIVHWGTAPQTTFAAGEDVLVLLGDHTHHHTCLSAFVEGGRGGAGLVAQVSDTPDQAGVEFYGVRVGEGLRCTPPAAGPSTEAGTGAFLCDGALRPHEMITTGGVPPLEFLTVRSAGRPVRADRADSSLWRRVVDRRSARQAKGMLFGQVTKKTSGPVSRHINARLSIPISKLLIETGISPHMVTILFVLTTGLATAVLIAHPEPYWRLALAGFCWQMAAVLDRCDGEIARVKLCESKFGAWFDTVTDNVAYLTVYVSFLLAIRYLHPDQPLYFYAGISAVVAMLVALGVMYNYALRTGSGSLQNYLVGFARYVPQQERGVVFRLLERYALLAKRDTFSFVHFVCCLLGSFDMLYLFTVGGLHLVTVGVLISQGKMLEGHRRLAEAAAAVPAAAGAAAVTSSEETPR